MPFETYYEHGGLDLHSRNLHKSILRHFLRLGTAPQLERFAAPAEAIQFKRLVHLGILEASPTHPLKDYRIPPHLVEAVGKFVGKPKK